PVARAMGAEISSKQVANPPSMAEVPGQLAEHRRVVHTVKVGACKPRPGSRCTPASTAGHAASNCTLPPKIVHGVDQATTGMVRPVHVRLPTAEFVFLQPQSTVLMAYQPGASGVPAFSPTVSPG